PDRGMETDRPELRGVEVFHTVVVPGETVTHVAGLGRREPVRLYGQAASAWVVDLGAAEVPCRQLTVRVEKVDFNRPFQIDAWFGDGFAQVHSGSLQPTRPGSREAGIDLGQEVRTKQL